MHFGLQSPATQGLRSAGHYQCCQRMAEREPAKPREASPECHRANEVRFISHIRQTEKKLFSSYCIITNHQPHSGLSPPSHQHHSRITFASTHISLGPHHDPDATHIPARHASPAQHTLHALWHNSHTHPDPATRAKVRTATGQDDWPTQHHREMKYRCHDGSDSRRVCGRGGSLRR